jgi:C1A family cysteine protease
LEGAWKISTGKLVSLSEQQFVDCSKNDGNSGCNGGAMDGAFTYAEANAICTEDSYKYSGVASSCKASNCTVGIPKGAVKGFKDVPSRDLNALMEAVAQQPVSVAIEADQMAFQLYQHGILGKQCGSKLDHGVLLVGYGTENGTDYWKVKNSWGPGFGENGYIRLQRGVTLDGECGIKLGASYPVVQAASDPSVVIV